MAGLFPRLAAAGTAGLLLVGCAVSRHGSEERPLLTGVDVSGNHQVKQKPILQAIGTVPTGRGPFAPKHLFDPDLLGQDLERIVRFYRARGFYSARVMGWRLAGDGRGRARLRLIVDEGKPTVIRSLHIAGLDDVSKGDRQFIEADLPLLEGTRIDETSYEEEKRLLSQRLRLRGYAEAQVEGEVHVDPETGAAQVDLVADAGRQYRLGAISVVGNRHTQSRPIVWASALSAGQLYSSARVDEAQRAVYDLGVFHAVEIQPGTPEEDRLPLRIRVAEGPLQETQWGAGGGVDRIRNEAHLRFGYRNKDVLGGLELLEASLQAGWAVLPGVINPVREGPIWKGALTLRRPNFVRRGWLLSGESRVEHDLEEAYDSDEARASAGVDKQIQEVSIGGGYGLEVYRVYDYTAGTSAPVAYAPDRCPTPCVLSWVEPRVVWDHRNDVVEPRRGWWVGSRVEKGGGVLGGTHDYWKAEPEARIYATPNIGQVQRLTFAARARFGWMFPQNGASPVVRRFFAGGPDSNRGYASRRLSPMVHDQNGRLVPIGGDREIDTSFETRVWIRHDLSGVLFLDGGWVDFAEITPGVRQLAWAAGPGVRWFSPIGPVRLDIGYRFYEPASYSLDTPVERVDEPRLAFHVGLGEAF